MDMNDFRVIELISGRKIAVKRGFFVFMNPECDEDRHDLSRDIDDGLIVINLNAVAVIREPEEHETEWCMSFHFRREENHVNFCKAEDMTFTEWLKTVSPWMWNQKIATLIYEIYQDPNFPKVCASCAVKPLDYEDYYRYLYHEKRVGDDRIVFFDVLWTAYIAQTRGERWIKPDDGDPCYLPF